ncbi:hypothetical protein [Acidianus sp. HS-5]|uniref:hypothetical protein n=1 Tax=Acidianus sp. HS-5 TaxID=2886040 RepID=UPI001F1813DD|nr:hypothetical protein [Acidianus sp. HS-5]BDC17434.1 hypothetical protein HS5_03240 [Acidianus sp. HS-5]
MGVKILRGVSGVNGIFGTHLSLDEKDNRYPNHDYRIIIDYLVELTRLVIGDPDERLEW